VAALMSSIGKDFRDFIMRGNVVDLATAVIIGAAFGAIVSSFVDDLIMPPIGLLLGKVDFSNLFLVLRDGAKTASPYASLGEAKAAGAVTLNYGLFVTKLVSFVIIAWVVFMIVRAMAKLRPKPVPAPSTKECLFCFSVVPLKATRCPHCTSELP
jgi:large conductance mechanosensitive channel